MHVEVADDRDLLQDIFPHFRYAVEEEEGEDSGYRAEADAHGSPIPSPVSSEHFIFMHPCPRSICALEVEARARTMPADSSGS